MREQSLLTGVQVTGSPVTRPRQRGIERLPLDHDLVARELAYPRGHHMHVNLVIALGPIEPDRVARAQLSRIVSRCPLQLLGTVGSATACQQ
jgi:hypothetical protein